MNIAIIGGGAAGLMAALAVPPQHQVLLLERQSRVGRKLLATGNGRCNLSNQNLTPANYHGSAPDFARYALAQFGPAQTLDFFRALGLFTVTEPSGRVYPMSDSANSVVDVLRLALAQRKNVRLVCGAEVTAIHPGPPFCLTTGEARYTADRVIVTAGGAAGSKLGGGTGGYQLLKALGHSCTKLYPSLAQLRTDPTYPRSLKGVRVEGVVTLYDGKKRLARQQGEIQFTEYGVSGPAVFALSRAAAPARPQMAVMLDLMPEVSAAAPQAALAQRCQSAPDLTCEALLTGMLHNRLGRTLLRYAGFSLTRPLGTLSAEELTAIAAAVHAMRLPVTGNMGMDAAQVTAGGIATEEFDPRTMQSRLVPGLYAAGEVLDIDGDCGGYNLQWAWSSGHLAGQLRKGGRADAAT